MEYILTIFFFFRWSRNVIHSVVAILTLELTGIPISSSDRSLPWLHPEFVPKPSTRSSNGTFEVSLFESEEAAFIIPADLYKWRLRRFEDAVVANDSNAAGVDLIDFYVNLKEEDAQFDPFRCKVLRTVEDYENEIHFQRSGYQSVEIQYDSNEYSNAPPWNFSIKGEENKCPLPPCLTNSQQKALVGILNTLDGDPDVQSIFSSPVNINCFVDYLVMVELPMDTSMIRERLEKKYYTNVFSVRADMKLILDNCLKYNKSGTDISNVAIKMYERFSQLFDEKMSEIGYDPTTRQESERTFIIVPVNGVSQLESLPNEEVESDIQLNGDDNSVIVNHQPDRSSRSSRRAARAQGRQLRSNEEAIDAENRTISRRAARARGRQPRSNEEAADAENRTISRRTARAQGRQLRSNEEAVDAENRTISRRAARAQERELRSNANVAIAEESTAAPEVNNTNNRSSTRPRRIKEQRFIEDQESDHDALEDPLFSNLKVIVDNEEYAEDEKPMPIDSTRAERLRRRSSRQQESDVAEDESLGQENAPLQEHSRPIRIRISTRTRARATVTTFQSEDEFVEDGEESGSESEGEPLIPRQTTRTRRGSSRQAPVVEKIESSDVEPSSENEVDSESDDDVDSESDEVHSNDEEERPNPTPRHDRVSRRSSRLSSNRAENYSSDEEHSIGEESLYEKDENTSPVTRTRATRSAATCQDQRPSRPSIRGRKRPRNSEDEEGDPSPRRSTRGNTIGSINTESSQRTSRPTRSSTRETAASLNNHPPTRASQNATSSLEDLPSSPGFRESPRRKSSITSPNYHDLSNSELSESEHDERPKRKRVRISPPKQGKNFTSRDCHISYPLSRMFQTFSLFCTRDIQPRTTKKESKDVQKIPGAKVSSVRKMAWSYRKGRGLV